MMRVYWFWDQAVLEPTIFRIPRDILQERRQYWGTSPMWGLRHATGSVLHNGVLLNHLTLRVEGCEDVYDQLTQFYYCLLERSGTDQRPYTQRESIARWCFETSEHIIKNDPTPRVERLSHFRLLNNLLKEIL